MPRKKKEVLIGNGMNADLLKQFIDLSYEPKNMSAPEGFELDAPLSDSRVKVYTKNNSKDVIVTHRGSVGASDWIDNARYAVSGNVKGTATYKLHRARHKKAVEKYGASNIIAIGHSRAGLYIQELQKEFPIKENITYNKASGFHDIGRQNDPNQTDVRVGNDVVSLLAPLQNSSNKIVNISGTKNPLSFVTAHATGEINKLGKTFIGKKDEPEPEPESMEGSGAIKRKRGRPRKVKVIIEGSGIGSSKNKVAPEDIVIAIPTRKPARVQPAPLPPPQAPIPPPQGLSPAKPTSPRINPDFRPSKKYIKKGGNQLTGLPAVPLPPPLTNQQVEDMLHQMNPNDVRQIPLDNIRYWIRQFRVIPTGQHLFNLIYFAGMTGYVARPLERAFIDDGGASGSGIGSSKTSRVAPHDIQVVFPQYAPDRPVQIHPEPAPVTPPPPIPRPPRRPRQTFHSPQRPSKFHSKKGASSSASGSASGSGLSSSKPEYLPPYLIEGYQTPIEGNLRALEYYKKLRDDLLKELADRNYQLNRDDLPAKYKQLIRLDNRIHYLEKLTQKQPIMDSYSIQEAERKRLEMKQPEDLEGEGFNKKQLRQII